MGVIPRLTLKQLHKLEICGTISYKWYQNNEANRLSFSLSLKNRNYYCYIYKNIILRHMLWYAKECLKIQFFSGEKMKLAFEFLLVQFNYTRKKRITNTKLFSTVNYIAIIIRNKTIKKEIIQGYRLPSLSLNDKFKTFSYLYQSYFNVIT